MCKISVMTCTCRDNPNLDKMAKCLVEQTFTDFEWVIVDRKIRYRPHYYDKIRGIVQDKFPVKAIEPKWSIYHDYNMPAMANARNSGILWAQGDLLVWVDDNIWFKPDFLQIHYDGNQVVHEGKPCYMVGLGWCFDDWDTVPQMAEMEPYDVQGKFCRVGDWATNNPQFGRDNGQPCDDPRAYLTYPWPDGVKKTIGKYEGVTGAWCYGRNMSMPREIFLAINGNDEGFDGTPGGTDIEAGLRLNNYGYTTLLNRDCCVYEYNGKDNARIQDVLPFTWGHINKVNGVGVSRSDFCMWAIMKTPSRIRANAHFDLRQMRDEFRNNSYRIEIGSTQAGQ